MGTLLYGLEVTAIGTGVAFATLYVLYLLLSFFNTLFGGVEERAGAEPAEGRGKLPGVVAEGADRSTVALISAVIASVVDTPIGNIKIRRVWD